MDTNESRLNNRHNVYHRRAYTSIGNNSLMVTRLEYSCDKIHKELSGFKIVHISDLHNHSFGSGQSKLVAVVKHERPDIIVVTGDSIDRRRTDIEAAMAFFTRAANLSRVLFVTGNHEALSGDYKEFSEKLIDAGVTILDNNSIIIKHNNTSLKVIGLPDAAMFGHGSKEAENKARTDIEHTLKNLLDENDSCFNILLSHRPELIDIYSKYEADLVFSGHAHGGQVRLPLIGGLLAPGQGMLPSYTSGIYYTRSTALVVSRGLGNSIFPLRIFNPPEVISLTLKSV